MDGKTAQLTRYGGDIGTWMALEIFVATLSITIATQVPGSQGLEADDIALLAKIPWLVPTLFLSVVLSWCVVFA